MRNKRTIKTPYDTVTNKYVSEDEAYTSLGQAIVRQAVEDYEKNLRKQREIEDNLIELENFFLSDWCLWLCDIDGNKIIEALRRKYE